MAKDPAFLFYSKDFYEGTRTMLPEERACYIDLLIYQHQNGGFIPNDPRRILMYCSGCSEATLQATLEAKFKLCENGWVNLVLQKRMDERDSFSKRQSTNGAVGQFFKKAKAILSKKDYDALRQCFDNQSNDEIFKTIEPLEINEATLQAMLEAMLQAKLKHLEDVNGNGIVIKNEDVGEIINLPREEKNENADQIFEQFRKAYPGTKKGHGTELSNFKKRKGWIEILPKLMPGLIREQHWRNRMAMTGGFVPEWQHLQTWINQSGWEKEFPEPGSAVKISPEASSAQRTADVKNNILSKLKSNGHQGPIPTLEIAAVSTTSNS